MKFFPNKFQITRRDIFIAIVSVISTLILGISTFVINEYIESTWFKEAIQEFTLADSMNYLPLTLGNTWVYSGVVKGQTADSDGKTITKTFDDYTFTIEKVIDKNNVRAAVVTESYSLIDLLEDKKQEQQELWILLGGKLYVISDPKKIKLYLRDLQQINPTIEDFEEEDQAWDFPLFVGKKYKLIGGLIDSGNRYSYNITDKQKINISGIIDNKECYKREILTNPDESYSWFCPGIGIVEESYIHNGTILNINYKLKQYFIK